MSDKEQDYVSLDHVIEIAKAMRKSSIENFNPALYLKSTYQQLLEITGEIENERDWTFLR